MAFAFFRPSTRAGKAGGSLVRYKGQLGTWYIGYRNEHGRRAQIRSMAATQAEAERIGAELERKAQRIRLGLDAAVKEDIAYREGVRLYLESLPPEYRSKEHLESRFRLRILPHLGDIMCRTMTPADVRNMLAANAKPCPSPDPKAKRPLRLAGSQTREHLRVAVQGSYTFLIDELKLVTGENPAAAVPKVKIPKRTPKFLRVEDVPRFLAAVPEQHRVLFTWAVGTGGRKGEDFALEFTHFGPQMRTVRFERSNDSDTTKSSKARTIPVPEWLAAIMREYAKTARSRWVFPDKRGQQQKKWVKLHLVMKAALCRAGLVEGFDHRCVTRGKRKGCDYLERRADNARMPCPKCGALLWPTAVPLPLSFKDLRSTFGTWAYAQTGDIRFVQQVLGHADVRVTEKRYSHVLDSHLLEQANRVQFGLSVPPDSISSLQHAGNQQAPKEANWNQGGQQ